MSGTRKRDDSRPSGGMRGVALVSLATCTLLLVAAGVPARAAWQQAGDLRIVVLDGEDSVNIVEQGTAVPTLVEVRDRNDLPVSGASVTFLLGEGGTATLNAGLSQVAVTTNALGQAAVTVNPIASGAVQLQVTAAFQGQTATAAIVQTNFATLAEAAAAGAGATGGAGGGGGGGTGAAGSAAGGAGGGLGTGAIVGIAAAGAGAALGGVTLSGGDEDDRVGPGPVDPPGPSPNNAPVAAVRITPDALGMAGLTQYRFDGSGSTDADGDALTYSWDFGDSSRGTGAVSTHTYERDGRFNATLTVRDGRDSSSATGRVRVGPDLTGRFVANYRGVNVDGDPDHVDIEFTLRQRGTMVTGRGVATSTDLIDVDEARLRVNGEISSDNNFICPCSLRLTITVVSQTGTFFEYVDAFDWEMTVLRGANVLRSQEDGVTWEFHRQD